MIQINLGDGVYLKIFGDGKILASFPTCLPFTVGDLLSMRHDAALSQGGFTVYRKPHDIGPDDFVFWYKNRDIGTVNLVTFERAAKEN